MNGAGVPKSVRALQSADIADTVNPDSVYVASGAPVAVRPPKPIVVLVKVLSGDGDAVEPPHPAPGTAARLKTTLASRRCLTRDLDCRTGRPASSRLLFPLGDSRTASEHCFGPCSPDVVSAAERYEAVADTFVIRRRASGFMGVQRAEAEDAFQVLVFKSADPTISFPTPM
jgi:hypothetical protein